MGGASYPAGVTSVYGETLKVSTALASLGLPGIETKQALIYNPNYDFRLHVNPAITAVLYYDASNDAGARYETAGATSTLSRDLTDRSATGTGTAMDTATSSDRLYICTSDIVRGFHIDMTDDAGGSVSTLTVKYWNGTAWTSLTISDGTDVAGDVFGRSGDITWTAPTAVPAHLGGSLSDNMDVTDADAPGTFGFWWQFLWSTELYSNIEIANIWTLNKDTEHRGYFHGGQEYPFSFDGRYDGAIEVVLDQDKAPNAGDTDTMEITWIRTII